MKPKIMHGTAQEIAEHGAGYSANGEGEFSRNVARPDHVRFNGYVRPRPQNVHATHATDIQWNEVEIERMRRKLTLEKNPERRAKLEKSISIKRAFVERLKHE